MVQDGDVVIAFEYRTLISLAGNIMTWVTLLDLEQGGALQLTGQTSFCIEEKGNKVV